MSDEWLFARRCPIFIKIIWHIIWCILFAQSFWIGHCFALRFHKWHWHSFCCAMNDKQNFVVYHMERLNEVKVADASIPVINLILLKNSNVYRSNDCHLLPCWNRRNGSGSQTIMLFSRTQIYLFTWCCREEPFCKPINNKSPPIYEAKIKIKYEIHSRYWFNVQVHAPIHCQADVISSFLLLFIGVWLATSCTHTRTLVTSVFIVDNVRDLWGTQSILRFIQVRLPYYISSIQDSWPVGWIDLSDLWKTHFVPKIPSSIYEDIRLKCHKIS